MPNDVLASIHVLIGLSYIFCEISVKALAHFLNCFFSYYQLLRVLYIFRIKVFCQMFCKHFLPICGLAFIQLGVLKKRSLKFLVSPFYPFVLLQVSFGALSKKYLQGCKDFLICFLEILGFIFRCLNHFKLNFYMDRGVYWISFFNMWVFNCSSTICWKNILHWIAFALLLQISVSLFQGSILFHWSIFTAISVILFWLL